MTVAYFAVFVIGWSAVQQARPVRAQRRPGLAGIGLWLVVALPSVLQLAVPALLHDGMRRTAEIRDGQLWRLVTSMVLQDGGVGGTVSNLTLLAVTVLVTAWVLPGRRLPTVFVVCGILANVLTVLSDDGDGAGSSMATMGLVTTAAVLVAAREGRVTPLLRWARVAAIVVCAVALRTRGDMHGWAVVVGLLVGAVAAQVPSGVSPFPSRARRRPPSR